MSLITTAMPVAMSSVRPVYSSDDTEAILERILRNPRIPSPSALTMQVLQKTGQEDCTVQEISELLAHDAGLCVKILRTLNSVVYARPRAITSIWQAVTMLGNRPLRVLVLGLALPTMQSGVVADAGLRKFWQRSVTGAVIARDLATHLKMKAPDDEMAASLLRDLGMILLQQTFPEKYRPIWEGESEIPTDVQCEWERSKFGVSHAEVSAALLKRWRLPIEITEPIRLHHHPDQLDGLDKPIVERTLLLDFVSRLVELEECYMSATSMEVILHAARDRYNLSRTDLERFLAEVRPKIEELSKILGVDIGACPDLDELLTTGCEELVRASLESVTATSLEQTDAEHEMTIDQSVMASSQIRNLFEGAGNLKPGSRILDYEIVDLLGQGAMGIVLKAFDPGLSRHVAIKVLLPEIASIEKARQRFALEARFAAALRHEHVVAIYSVNEMEGMPFLVMEYVRGSSLDDLLASGYRFSASEIARIGRQTALGLAAAHEARVIHRDIKPANILLEEKNLHVRVADFGLARALDEDFQLSQPGLLLGTPNFMSPEQVDGTELTAATDLFSLGSVLYVMCTGTLPFQSKTMTGLLNAVATKEPIPIRAHNPSIPSGLAHLIETLHAKKPVDRPTSAAEVAESLKRWCAGSECSSSYILM